MSRLANLLGLLVASHELSDIPSQLDEAGEPYYLDKLDRRQYLSKFDSTKMWIEYMNRVLGVLIGIFIIATFVALFLYENRNPVCFTAHSSRY